MTPATVITHDGIKQSVKEWALDYGITPGIIIARLERGIVIADAIKTPMKVGHRGQRLPIFSRNQSHNGRLRENRAGYSYQRKHLVAGRLLTLSEWAAALGITYNALCQRMHKLGSLEAVVLDHEQRTHPGVVSDLQASKGTGGGSLSQAKNPEYNFSGNEA